MQLPSNLLKELNNQIREELYASNVYLLAASHFGHANLNGFKAWLEKQSNEEREHAKKFYDFIIDRNDEVDIQVINAPKYTGTTPRQAFDEILALEEHVTERINMLMELAESSKDHATCEMLLWFVKEQVDSEKFVTEVIDKLDLISNNNSMLLVLDEYMGEQAK